ncbi:hypothetical protein Poly51_54470 [Rubripirellula tenax]|uniref:Uncharacterized protein n=1 Tax=Rubripirellula tenax TaxID=2528015 RepID=A0A5C6EGS5_9BACT|nr:hypothetical protein Poly51_54470 [Rubripirellula tenax]
MFVLNTKHTVAAEVLLASRQRLESQAFFESKTAQQPIAMAKHADQLH